MPASKRLVLGRPVAVLAVVATAVATSGLVGAGVASAATGTLTLSTPTISNQNGKFPLSGTSNGTLFDNTSTLQLSLPSVPADSRTFTATNSNVSQTITVTADPSLLDAGAYTAYASGELGQSAGCTACFTITGSKATVSSLTLAQNDGTSADQIGQGSVARAFTLTGTNFTLGTTASVPANSGLTLTQATVTSPTTITGTLAASATATVGAQSITVTQPPVQATQPNTVLTSLSVNVTAAPALTAGTSSSPAADGNVARVPAAETDSIGLAGTNLATGAVLTSSVAGVSFANTSVTSATAATTKVAVAPGTTTANTPVTVTNNDGGTSTTASGSPVLRTLPARPTVTGTSPTAPAASTTTVTVTGTNFLAGATVSFPDDTTGQLTVGAVTVNSSTSLTVPVTVPAQPANQAYKVTVTDPDSISSAKPAASGAAGTCANPCLSTVPFVLTGVSPSAVQNDSDPKTVTVTGSTFATTDNYSIVLTPPASDPAQQPIVTAVPSSGVTTTMLTTSVNVEAAEAGAYTVGIITSDNRAATCPASTPACAFNVNDAQPSVTSLSPTTLVPGQSSTVTLNGTNFTNGSTLASTNAGDVTISNVTVVSSTVITATVTAASSAATSGTTSMHVITLATADATPKTTTAGTISVVTGPAETTATPPAVTAGGEAPAAANGSVAVSNPTPGETFDGNTGDGGQLRVDLSITGPAGLSASTVHVSGATLNGTAGTVTVSFPAASYKPGINTSTPFTLTLDKAVAAGTLTIVSNLNEVSSTGAVLNTLGATTNTVTVNTLPGAPTGVAATAGKTSLSVAFTAPSSTGGAAITGYRVTYTPAGGSALTAKGTSSPIVVTGLTGGTVYTVTVAATSDTGSAPVYGAESTSSTGTPYDVPGAPTSVSAVAGNTTAAVSFTAPASTNGSAITGYTVTPYSGSPSSAGTPQTATSSPYTFTGLTNGTAYTFTVTATNAAGAGAASPASNSVTPKTEPGAPTGVSVADGNMQTVVSFTASTSNGGVAATGFRVTATPPSGPAVTATGMASPITVAGLTNGTAYSVTVAATSDSGGTPTYGAESSPAVSSTPFTTPGTPGTPTATAGNTTASISFTAPASNGGRAITGYTVTPSTGIAQTATSSPYTFTGLTNGTAYTFTVTAVNAAGSSTASAASNSVTPKTTPGAPTGVSVKDGNAQTVVTFTAPANNGGAAVTGYRVTATPSGGGNPITVLGTASPITVTGLANGTTYAVTVAATSDAGATPSYGPESSPSVSSTPRTVPGAPSGVTATPSNAQATVSWSAPASNGSAITSYTVTPSTGAAQTATSSPYTFTGLTNGTAYTFTVTATNAAGAGAASPASNSVTPKTEPGAPTGVSVADGNMQTVVSFTASTSNGGVAATGFRVTATPPSGPAVTATGMASPITVAGLTNGTAYSVTVAATSDSGGTPTYGVESSAATSIPGVPGTPTAVAGNASATISFAVPTGSGVTNYTVTAYSGSTPGTTQTATTSPYTFTGLTNGTAYTFTVTANKAGGSSTLSPASNAVTPSTAPGAPTNVTAVAGNGQATVSWTPPVNNGGSPISSYVITTTPGGPGRVSAVYNSFVIRGLTNGVSYTFTVSASNQANPSVSGPNSAPSNAVVPAGPPAAPTAVTATPGDGGAVVGWSAPSGNGSPITNYTVSAYSGTTVVATVQAGTATSATVTGLTNGTAYTFTVTATNAIGTSAASTASAAVTPLVPVTTKPATSVSLSQNVTFLTLGKTAVLSGKVLGGSAPVAAGTPVTLKVTYTDGKVVTLATVATAADGSFRYSYHPAYNGTITATAGGITSKGVLAKVIVVFTSLKTSVSHGRITIRASTAPGFLTTRNRPERAQLLIVSKSGKTLLVVDIVLASQRHGAAGQKHGVNDLSYTTNALPVGTYYFAYKVLGTPVNTGAESKPVSARVR